MTVRHHHGPWLAFATNACLRRLDSTFFPLSAILGWCTPKLFSNSKKPFICGLLSFSYAYRRIAPTPSRTSYTHLEIFFNIWRTSKNVWHILSLFSDYLKWTDISEKLCIRSKNDRFSVAFATSRSTWMWDGAKNLLDKRRIASPRSSSCASSYFHFPI